MPRARLTLAPQPYPPPLFLLAGAAVHTIAAAVQAQVARITSAELQPNSAKLLKLQADLGEGDARQIMAGAHCSCGKMGGGFSHSSQNRCLCLWEHSWPPSPLAPLVCP